MNPMMRGSPGMRQPMMMPGSFGVGLRGMGPIKGVFAQIDAERSG